MRHDRLSAATALQWSSGWRAAQACGPNGGNCVEVNLTRSNTVGVRDTKRLTGEVALAFSTASWAAFLGAARAGHLDRR